MKIKSLLRATLTVIFCAIPLTWVVSAYAANLSTIGMITTAGDFQKEVSINPALNNNNNNNKHTSRISDDSFVTGSDAPQNQTGPFIHHMEAFLPRWLTAVRLNPHRLLWSSYPASIRGQVFSGNAAGGDPMTSSSGW